MDQALDRVVRFQIQFLTTIQHLKDGICDVTLANETEAIETVRKCYPDAVFEDHFTSEREADISERCILFWESPADANNGCEPTGMIRVIDDELRAKATEWAESVEIIVDKDLPSKDLTQTIQGTLLTSDMPTATMKNCSNISMRRSHMKLFENGSMKRFRKP